MANTYIKTIDGHYLKDSLSILDVSLSNNGVNLVTRDGVAHNNVVADFSITDLFSCSKLCNGLNTTAEASYSHAEGIGTTTCLSGQHVTGTYNKEDDTKIFIVGVGTNEEELANGLAVSTDGCVWSLNGFFESSDIRKKNILDSIDLDKAYDLIDKCQTILYDLKDDPTHKLQVGLIALEVKEFFPELIQTDGDGMLSLDYSRLTVIIIGVLKDIINRLKKLEK